MPTPWACTCQNSIHPSPPQATSARGGLDFFFFNTRSASREPKLTGGQTPSAETLQQGEESAPGPGDPQQRLEITSPLVLSTPHPRSKADVHPGVQLTSPLYTLFPESTFRVCRGHQRHHALQSPDWSRNYLTVSQSQICPPEGQGKRMWHRLRKGFRKRSSKMSGAVATSRE